MTPALFAAAGRALFGAHYHGQLAKMLGCARWTVYRYEKGYHPVPAATAEMVRARLAGRRDLIDLLLAG